MTKRKSTIDERLAAVKEYTETGKPYEQIARERGCLVLAAALTMALWKDFGAS